MLKGARIKMTDPRMITRPPYLALAVPQVQSAQVNRLVTSHNSQPAFGPENTCCEILKKTLAGKAIRVLTKRV